MKDVTNKPQKFKLRCTHDQYVDMIAALTLTKRFVTPHGHS